MRHPSWPGFARLLLGVAMAAVLSGAAAPEPQAPEAPPASPWLARGPAQVLTRDLDWQDQARHRTVPVRLYYPAGLKAPAPLILFSHGLGGSREGYAYLGEYWASHGYVSVHLQHPGSDTGVWQNTAPEERLAAMRQAAADPRQALDRGRDVKFALDQLAVLATNDPDWRDRLDLASVGMAGHSFGAHTTLLAAGQLLLPNMPHPLSFRDPRILAAIPMSAPVPRPGQQNRAYSGIAIPLFHMTGTLDQSPIGDTSPEQRRIAFDKVSHAEQWLLTLKDGDHMVFSGRLPATARDEARDRQQQLLICQASTAFWEAFLRRRQPAREWLTNGGLATLVADGGKLEHKLPEPIPVQP